MQTKRKYHYDYIRALGVLCIIGIHSTDLLLSNVQNHSAQWWFGTLIQLVVRIGLPIFFMISGALILNSSNDNIGEFYKKRFLRILIPLFIYSFIYLFVFNYRLDIFKFNNFVESIKLILSNNVHYHLWFVYTILGIYICAPFIKIMVNNLKDQQLCVLIVILLAFRFIYTYLPMFGITIGINSIIFDGWTFYFILGYFLTRDIAKKYFNIIIKLGIISFICSIFILRFLPNMNVGLFDFAPTMLFITSAVFVLFEKNKDIINEKKYFYKEVAFISKYSYSIYLIHALILSKIVNEKLGVNALTHNFVIGSILTIILTSIFSIIAAFIIDNLIVNPIFRFTSKRKKAN
ncbi:acyltransferase [Paraclostridium bifermentans]|uniref:acyltransferase n=1 Tax=Paraclostridium bifermentans TaxID=1490 RepID=UPI0025B05734|nr:acyltransferase family protein [Paraclostridium bifermentans]